MVLTLRIYHAVYHAYFAICNLFQVLELNKQTRKNTEVNVFSWKWNYFERSDYREEKRICVNIGEKNITGIVEWVSY